jgi:hypothetical protein
MGTGCCLVAVQTRAAVGGRGTRSAHARRHAAKGGKPARGGRRKPMATQNKQTLTDLARSPAAPAASGPGGDRVDGSASPTPPVGGRSAALAAGSSTACTRIPTVEGSTAAVNAGRRGGAGHGGVDGGGSEAGGAAGASAGADAPASGVPVPAAAAAAAAAAAVAAAAAATTIMAPSRPPVHLEGGSGSPYQPPRRALGPTTPPLPPSVSEAARLVCGDPVPGAASTSRCVLTSDSDTTTLE